MPDEPSVLKSRVLLGALLVTLALVSVRAVLDIQRMLSEPTGDAQTSDAVQDGDRSLESIAHTPEGAFPEDGSADPRSEAQDPKSQSFDPSRLAPELLQDQAEIEDYLARFPRDDYEVVDVEGQGRFYIDDRSDEIKGRLAKGEVWEPKIDFVLRRMGRPGTTMIDVGAHIGTHTVTLAKIAGPEGSVYAFEPQKKLFRELVHNMSLNELENVVPLRFALGDHHGVIEMNEATEGNEGDTSVGSGGDSAELRTLDSFGFRNVRLIKIDVEGFERPVLQGARETIAQQQPVLLVEIEGGHSFDYAAPKVRARIVDTIQMIEAMGYHVFRLSENDYLGLSILDGPASPPAAPPSAAPPSP